MPARCFLALVPDATALAPLRVAQAAFLDNAPAWRGEKWVRPELQHVTIRFIGPLPDADTGALLDDLGHALTGIGSVRLRPAGVRALPSPRRATMLWATLEGDLEETERIHARVDAVLSQRVGLAPETRPFTPHLTLVRARSPRPVPEAALDAARAALPPAGKDQVGFASVRSLTLFASTLGREGPVYEIVGEVPLQR